VTAMENTRVEKIVIVGGGTAGWLAAAYLTWGLQARCRITLIEAADLGTIGVGEATVPTLRNTLKFIGVDEADWMHRCNGTFKLAIKFVHWSDTGESDVFWHPFGGASVPSVNGLHLSHYWLKRHLEQNDHQPFDESCFSSVGLCEHFKSPKRGTEEPYVGQVDYAYHLDATLLADYLKLWSTALGVRQMLDKVLDVELDERGYIAGVRTEKNGSISGDLLIDCTGFRGLLINQAMKEPFISFSDCLYCDRAIAMRIPASESAGGIEPYTTATALRAGWVWNIPLSQRVGTGYVYSSDFVSSDLAEQEFRSFLGRRAADANALHIKMRVGRTRNPWVKNCVNIGLSSGFIEPLESTGIYLIEMGLYNLLHYFPDTSFAPDVVDNYNRVMRHHYEHVRDFIVLHYCTTRREDTPFWKANRNHSAIPESLKEKLRFWRNMLPVQEYPFNPGLFTDTSYVCVLAGMGCLPHRSLPILQYGDVAQADGEFSSIAERAARLVGELPDHREFLAAWKPRYPMRHLVP
jgi:2-polyprenyl-6-methoxyphenol hydroxylase-like FAD-dependent oxidoreductase